MLYHKGEIDAGPVDSNADRLWISPVFTCTRVCVLVLACTCTGVSHIYVHAVCRRHAVRPVVHGSCGLQTHTIYITSTAPHDTPLGHPLQLMAATGLSVSRILSFRECYVDGIIRHLAFGDCLLFTQPEALEIHPGGGCQRLVPFECRAVYRCLGVPELSYPFTSSGAFGIFPAGG